MIDVKEAVVKAFDFIQDLFDKGQLLELMLEEVELVEDSTWRVTLGFNRLKASPRDWSIVGVPEYERVYKVIEIDANTRKVLSMKIRET